MGGVEPSESLTPVNILDNCKLCGVMHSNGGEAFIIRQQWGNCRR